MFSRLSIQNSKDASVLWVECATEVKLWGPLFCGGVGACSGNQQMITQEAEGRGFLSKWRIRSDNILHTVGLCGAP